MRFFKEGPNIPDLLLERRDQGQVVFLCGAGVSCNVGMPNFAELTKYVFDFFDPPEESQLAQAFQPWLEWLRDGTDNPRSPLDQIFQILHKEYGRLTVNALVAEKLKVTGVKGIKREDHEIIKRLSADQEGNPQIVTTNY